MRTVTVTGQGEARVAPDSAVVRVTAAHAAPGVAEALAGADSAARSIVATAREHTDAARVGSTGLSIWPATDREGRPAGFSAQHSLTISCADIESAGALLTALVEAVGDRLQVDGVSLEVADPRAAQTAARDAAYADAVTRATQLAGLAGAELGAVQEVVEGGSPSFPGPRMSMAKTMSASFEPGETSLGASVTVTFQLR
jgi:uncharacterized protein